MRVMLLILVSLWFTSSASIAAGPDNSEDICTSAAVIFCDNFENRSVGPIWDSPTFYKNNTWQIGSETSLCFRVGNTPEGIFDGSRSMEITYAEGATTGCGHAVTQWWFGPANAASFTELYFRVYTKHSTNFQFSNTANKWGGPMDGFTNTFIGGGGMRVSKNTFVYDICLGTDGWAQGTTVDPLGCNTAALQPYANLPGQHGELMPNENGLIPYIPGVWYCEEFHFRMNTCPTCADGVFEMWRAEGTNPAQTRHFVYTNQIIDGQTCNGCQRLGGWTQGSFWNCDSSFDTCCNNDPTPAAPSGTCYSTAGGPGSPPSAGSIHPLMYRWHDNYVISTQRIGCLNNPVIPPPVPTAPSNLQVTKELAP